MHVRFLLIAEMCFFFLFLKSSSKGILWRIKMHEENQSMKAIGYSYINQKSNQKQIWLNHITEAAHFPPLRYSSNFPFILSIRFFILLSWNMMKGYVNSHNYAPQFLLCRLSFTRDMEMKNGIYIFNFYNVKFTYLKHITMFAWKDHCHMSRWNGI